MRQVFSSPRLENVERVAKLLPRTKASRSGSPTAAPTRQRDPRQFQLPRQRRRRTAAGGVGRATRTTSRARAQILREAGLLHTAGMPMPTDSYIPETPHQRGESAKPPPVVRRTSRIRYGLLAGIVLMVALTYIATRRPETGAPAVATTPPRAAPAAPAAMPETIAAPSTAYVIATPPALAETLFAAELRAQDADLACLAIDGADPAPELLARLRGGVEVRAVSACAGEARARVAIDITRYRTDGSGVGTVAVVIHPMGDDAPAENRIRRLEVQRTGDRWNVLREL